MPTRCTICFLSQVTGPEYHICDIQWSEEFCRCVVVSFYNRGWNWVMLVYECGMSDPEPRSKTTVPVLLQFVPVLQTLDGEHDHFCRLLSRLATPHHSPPLLGLDFFYVNMNMYCDHNSCRSCLGGWVGGWWLSVVRLKGRYAKAWF